MRTTAIVLFLLSAVAVAQIADKNIDRSKAGWSICVKPNCNPGGTNPPAVIKQATGITAPSLEGSSMLLSQTSPADGNSNVLFTYKAGECNSCTTLVTDFWVYPTSGAAELEFDQFIFDEPLQVEFMFGMQCGHNGVWDIFNQLSDHWVHTNLACNVLVNTWNHIVLRSSRTEGDTSCDGYPCMYYDTISVNDLVQAPVPNVEPAGPLPSGWGSNSGFQVQSDIASPNTTVNEYLDLVGFTGSMFHRWVQ